VVDRRGRRRSGGAERGVNCLLEILRSVRQASWDDQGQTLVEYALVLMLVALLAIGPLTQIGVWVWNWLEPVGNAL
jgi:Flp pilus assembly pilin Flp